MKIFYCISGHGQIEELKYHISFLNNFKKIDKVFLSCSTEEMKKTFEDQYTGSDYEVILNEDFGYRKGCVVNVFSPLSHIREIFRDEDYYVVSVEADAFFTNENVILHIIHLLEESGKNFFDMDTSPCLPPRPCHDCFRPACKDVPSFSEENFNGPLQTINIFSKFAIENLLDLEIIDERIDAGHDFGDSHQRAGMEDYWRYSINLKNSLDTNEKRIEFRKNNVLILPYTRIFGDPFSADRYIRYSYMNIENTFPLQYTIDFINNNDFSDRWNQLES